MKPAHCLTALLSIATLTGCAATPTRDAAMPAQTSDPPRVLVFSRTMGFRHDSIPVAIETLQALGTEAGFEVDASEDPALFDEATLARYAVVVFANTTGDVLDGEGREAFERYIAQGGGYMGVHAAADTGDRWPWYGELVGAWFARHPEGLQSVRVVFEGGPGPDGRRDWQVTDEIYDYRRNPRPWVQVRASIDPASHPTGGLGEDHPIAWCHAQAGGRAWYTGLGHDGALYADAVFRAHLRAGLLWSSGRVEAC